MTKNNGEFAFSYLVKNNMTKSVHFLHYEFNEIQCRISNFVEDVESDNITIVHNKFLYVIFHRFERKIKITTIQKCVQDVEDMRG